MKLFNALYATPMIALPLDTAQPNVKRPEHTPKKTIIPCTEAQYSNIKEKQQQQQQHNIHSKGFSMSSGKPHWGLKYQTGGVMTTPMSLPI